MLLAFRQLLVASNVDNSKSINRLSRRHLCRGCFGHPAVMNIRRRRSPRKKRVPDWVPLMLAHADPLPPAVIEHILFGDASSHVRGGHRFESTLKDRSVFPERWTDEFVIEAVRLVLNQASSAEVHGRKVILQAFVDDVLIEVWVRSSRGGYLVETAFPKAGRGVMRNTYRGRVNVPLEITEMDE